MFTFSLKSNNEIFGENVIGLPKQWLWENYTAALTTGNMAVYFLNSFIVTAGTIALTIVAALTATYALERMVWRGRKLANNIFMLGLTVPIHAAILPVFIMLRNLKMTNSYQALIIPYSAFALAMAILISSSFIRVYPKNLKKQHVLTEPMYMGFLAYYTSADASGVIDHWYFCFFTSLE